MPRSPSVIVPSSAISRRSSHPIRWKIVSISTRHTPGATAIITSTSSAARSKARKTAMDQRISADTGTTSSRPATISPSARPSSTRSTTTVAKAVQNRGPCREAT